MTSRRALASASIGALLAVAACTPLLGGSPAVWPKEARLGETIGMALDSNYIPGPAGESERHHLSLQNVTIQLRQGSTILATLTPRAVFDGGAAPGSIRNQIQPGAWLTIAVFDLPTSLGVTLPATVTVRPMVGATPMATANLLITGSGGTPITFADSVGGDAFVDPEDLEPRASLRLQGRPDEGSGGFDPAWEIAGIQLELAYPTAKVESPDVFALSEASRGGAFVGPETTPGRVPIYLSDPRSFLLPVVATSKVGEGPLLDVTFDKLAGQGFVTSDFVIRDLKVVDRDGQLLTPVFAAGTDTTSYFVLTARRNLTE